MACFQAFEPTTCSPAATGQHAAVHWSLLGMQATDGPIESSAKRARQIDGLGAHESIKSRGPSKKAPPKKGAPKKAGPTPRKSLNQALLPVLNKIQEELKSINPDWLLWFKVCWDAADASCIL